MREYAGMHDSHPYLHTSFDYFETRVAKTRELQTSNALKNSYSMQVCPCLGGQDWQFCKSHAMAAKNQTKKPDPLREALAASFSTQKPSKPAPPASVPADDSLVPPQVSAGEGMEVPTPPKSAEPNVPVQVPRHTENENRPLNLNDLPPRPAGVKKTTVSLHSNEQDRVDEILDVLYRTKRHRGGFSDAVKIALKLCPLDPEAIAGAWEQARAQDLRTVRHRDNS